METYKLIKENGDELLFDNGKFFIRSLGGLGNPPINYATQETFYQDGQIITNFNAQPRQLNLNFYAKPLYYENERLDYWDLRLEILRFLNPQSGKMRFQLIRDDHVVFELTNVYPTDGLTMEGNTYNSERNDGTIDEQLTLTAFDPIWRKSNIITTGALTPSVDEHLVFPITFPIEFGSSGVSVIQSITYNGTWRSYPKITVKGPYTTCTITNEYNSSVISLIEPILSSEQRIIDLTNPIEGFTVKDAIGNSKFNEVNIGSNFVNFFFQPDSDSNGIDVALLGGNNTSRVTIEYYERYLGI